MKKLIINCIVLTFVSLFIGCKSIPQNIDYTSDYISKYYSTSDKDCNFIFEFINQSNKPLKLEGFIAETTKLINYYDPLVTTSVILVDAGECVTFKLNSDLLIKDFSKKYSIGINCFEKNWHWWQNINRGMKNNRFRVVVKNDSQEGGQVFNPSFKSKNKFEISEFNVEYEKRNYLSYLITETTDEYKSVFDLRVFYINESNNSSRVSNLFTCSCKDTIQELLDNGDFSIIKINDGTKILALNKDPLDLNNYISNDNYDFIYEIVNNSSDKISAANILFDDDKFTNLLGLSNDVEIEPGKSCQLKYNLETLKKIYGDKGVIGIDVKKSSDKQWIRGWANTFNHKNDKHIVVVSDGTQDRALDIFDLWKDFSDLEKGIMIY